MTAKQTQIRRGTDGEVTANVPALGEIWYNITKKRLHVGDGATYGGTRTPNAQDIQAGTYDYAAAGGTADAITASTDTNPASMVSGLSIRVKIASANTGAATLQWGSLAATSIKKYASGSKTALSAGDLVAGKIYTFDYDGTDWVVSGGGIDSGVGITTATYTFTSSGSYTKPSGLLFIEYTILGGGGGGGGAKGQTLGYTWIAGGGGGGGLARGVINAADLSASETITIGAGGAAGSSSGGTGGTGGTSSIGSLASASGGAGGQGVASGSGSITRAGGAGGIGSGDVNSNGWEAGLITGVTRYGGLSPLLNTGYGTSTLNVNGGAADANTGSGGAGAYNTSNTDHSGGAGGSGLVVITEYVSA